MAFDTVSNNVSRGLVTVLGPSARQGKASRKRAKEIRDAKTISADKFMRSSGRGRREHGQVSSAGTL